MKRYRIEHIGVVVKEPLLMAQWYREVLGFNVKFTAEDHEKAVAFLTPRTR